MSTPVPLVTPIAGDPEQVRRVSAQLATVETRAREIESRLRAMETGVGPQMWRGQAADGFAALLAETGPDLTRLAASYGSASQALATYATELAAAQDAARAAEAEATTATGDRDRATAERDSADADAVRHAAAADEARARLDPVAAQEAERGRTDALGRASAAGAAVDQADQALRVAQQKADEAADRRNAAAVRCTRELDAASNAVVDIRYLTQAPTTPNGPSPAGRNAVAGGIADEIAKNITDDLGDKSLLHASDLTVGGVAGGVAAHRVSSLLRESTRLAEEAERADARYRAAPGGSPESRFQNELAQRKRDEADALRRRADAVGSRVGARIGVAGLGISALGVGYDILNGKPLVKAAVSGVGGTLAAGVTGARFGALIGSFVGGPVVGTVAGAVIGWGFGVATSAVIDWGYDQLPKPLKQAVEDATRPIDDAVKCAKKIWDSIF